MMNSRLPAKILPVYNNRAATPATHEARKSLSHKAFRASCAVAAAGYLLYLIWVLLHYEIMEQKPTRDAAE